MLDHRRDVAQLIERCVVVVLFGGAAQGAQCLVDQVHIWERAGEFFADARIAVDVGNRERFCLAENPVTDDVDDGLLVADAVDDWACRADYNIFQVLMCFDEFLRF